MSRQFLLFRIHAPFAAFGNIAVGTERDTVPHPTKSAIIGLIAAALGIKRNEQAKIETLTEELRCAVRVDTTPFFWRDYHTVQTPGALPKAVSTEHWKTRWQELGYGEGNRYAQRVQTILSYRNYISNALYTICLWQFQPEKQREGDWKFPLTEIEKALKHPIFMLYAGRKSCPLALPLNPDIVQADTVKSAFEKYTNPENEEKREKRKKENELLEPLLTSAKQTKQYFWENDGDHIGIKPTLRTLVRDEPRSRTKWQFGERFEYSAIEDITPLQQPEAPSGLKRETSENQLREDSQEVARHEE
jgi:CRISPR system Cascade subunit CasD